MRTRSDSVAGGAVEHPGYIVVEGPVGVGKTSLAKRLAESFGGEILLEDPESNPFLERFYREPRRYALATQLCFLFDRARQLESLRQPDLFRPRRIADFLLQKDLLFARLNLDDDEHRLYREIYDRLAPSVPPPDLVIYLQAPPEILMQRVRRRAVPYEQDMDPAYLERLCDAYSRFFFTYTDAPLLMINAANINLVDGDDDFRALLEYLSEARKGRHFLNPLGNRT